MSSTNILPEYADTLICNNVTFYKETEELFNIFKNVLDAVSINLELNTAYTSLNALCSITDIFVKMNNLKFVFDESVELSDNFKLFYIEKFETLHSNIKQNILNTLGNNNIFFKNFSEDIGILLDRPIFRDGNNINWSDIFYENTDIPTYLPASAYNKISTNTKENILTAALMTDSIMKNNMLGIADYTEDNLSEKSHGKNLVTDSTYYRALLELVDEQSVEIMKIFGNYLGEIILFIKDLTPRNQPLFKSKLISYKGFIEGIEQELDIFNSTIASTAYISNDILR